MVFGIYALAVLAALLIVGSLSDHVGRRPVLLAPRRAGRGDAGLCVADRAAGSSDRASHPGPATGSAAGAIGAGMLDIDRAKGTVANSVAP